MLEGNALTILIVASLLLLAAICSGLNIAVMALDLGDLERKAKLGNRQALRILPLRRNVHLLLGSILFTNVAAASATAIVLGSQLHGLVAGLISTLLLVIFGEVLPQAVFSKNTLLWTSRFAPLLRLMVILTYPLSKPLQLALDYVLPRHVPLLQSRHELGLMMREHGLNNASELDEDEVEIIQGALQLSEKQVQSIMTDIDDTYWLTPDTVLDGSKIDEIKAQGYSRIPIFDTKLTRCHGVLLMKDMVDIDFDANHYTVGDIPLHSTKLVGSKTALDTMFRKFIAAHSHLIPVERDDKIIGIITIEDLIEEIIGHEIEDETDRNRQS